MNRDQKYGYDAHKNWERRRCGESECIAEKRIGAWAARAGFNMKDWWNGWFQGSEEWRDKIGRTDKNL
jgi:hypothetical protein